MPARIRRIRHDENTRMKIKAAQLINRLTKHVNGDIDMKATQVNAALGLLRKCLPDLAAVEWSGEVTTKNAEEMTKDELAEAIRRITGGNAKEGSTGTSDPVH
ncbi:MAG: hypothetical protein KZQ94_15965 [Candidatus Thiodiazotropha sp. (ex Troendleina suluensis)]|nr:hypothetical protein [Candidatus Thiodiazotropha sp. (ex Troendleina suluensis)]